MADKPYRYLLVGSGWRSGVFLKLARLFPERLEATGVVSHTQDRADQVAAETGLPTSTNVAELVKRSDPDFVVVLLPWDIAPKVSAEVAGAGKPVLCETPPALDLDGLRWVWGQVGDVGRVASAEQYLRYPGHAARLKVLRSGLIGSPQAVHVSQSHMYHEFSIIRHFLGVGLSSLTVNAFNTSVRLVEPQDYGDWIDSDGTAAPIEPTELDNNFAHLVFDQGGWGTYDFAMRQWWNPLRVDRVVVNGARGQLLDNSVTWLETNRRVLGGEIFRRYGGDEMTFEPRELDHIAFGREILWTNHWLGGHLTDDDLAVADHLAATGAWALDEGPSPYSLAEACHDHAITLAVEESIASGRPVRVEQLPWQR
ncbi:MAG: Gfo/Idh/MocA family oxidoreductase [Bifidobacteriaceae bacterium]|jgi:predicted dehydrogenase|nr:Gfo/Idh/MocA family oxidoreductase [Bifidobacteriaceae bacterium]